jgi:16S rRNA (guanine527-N7)-methyltransferase
MIIGFEEEIYKAFGLSLTGDQIQMLGAYVDQLREWSGRVRLISKGDRDLIWERHITDALSVVTSLPQDGLVMDFGSGAGLPGIPMGIMRPDIEVHLLEPTRMKAIFLKQVIQDLGLNHVNVLRFRSEELLKEGKGTGQYDCVTARAVAALPQLWEMTNPFLSKSGKLLALKGPNPLDEFEGDWPNDIQYELKHFTLPFCEKERALVILRHVSRETL